ncbi:MAG: DUF5615 family PIN-like protein [Stellaceae bacterium]
MRWLVDECVDGDLVGRLRDGGHDVLYAAEMASGATDAEVMRQALRNNRLLLTEDKDFGELAFRLGLPVLGIVLLRLNPERRLLNWPRLRICIDYNFWL